MAIIRPVLRLGGVRFGRGAAAQRVVILAVRDMSSTAFCSAVVDADGSATDKSRWLGRLCLETQVSLRQAQLLAVSLAGLPDRAAATALAAGCADLGLSRAAAAARALS